MRTTMIAVTVCVLGGCYASAEPTYIGTDAGIRTWACSAYPVPGDPPLRYDGAALRLDIGGCTMSVSAPSDGPFALDGEWIGTCPGVSKARVGLLERQAEAIPADGTFAVYDLEVETPDHRWHFPLITCHEILAQ